MKKNHTLLLFASLLILSQSCSLKDPEEVGVICGDKTHPLSYVIDKECPSEKCDRDSGKYDINFHRNHCPIEYNTCGRTDDTYYCGNCGEGQILCDGECIKPDEPTNLKYCGAKGLCYDSAPDSENYKGFSCGEGTSCIQVGEKYECMCADKPCDGKCVNDICIKQGCEPNVCSKEQCLNDDDRCGPDCINCGPNAKCNKDTGKCECTLEKDKACGAKGKCDNASKDSDDYMGVDCGNNATCNDSGICECQTHWCDAKGLCNNSSKYSADYAGIDCGNDADCVNGECVCNTGFCGARGACNVRDADSPHYKGVDCGENADCINDVCVCNTGYCGAIGLCNAASPSSDNYMGENCKSQNKVCDEEHGHCVSCQANSETYVDGKCVETSALDCGEEHIDCTKTISNWASSGLFCVDGACKVTKCQEGSITLDSTTNQENYIQGYHVAANGTKCEQDSDTKCGSNEMNCQKDYIDEMAETKECRFGKCVSTKCKILMDDTTGSTNNDKLYLGRVYIPSYNLGLEASSSETAKCIEANGNKYCGRFKSDCTQKGNDCREYVPTCAYRFCKKETSYTQSDCLINYLCGCPVGQHIESGQCRDDNLDNCGSYGHKCPKKVDGDHIANVQCVNGVCNVTCENNYSWCHSSSKCETRSIGMVSNCNDNFLVTFGCEDIDDPLNP